MASLRKRLGRQLLFSMLLILAGLLLAMNLAIRDLVGDYVASRLEHDLDTLVSALQRDGNGHWSLDERMLSSVYRRVRSGHYYRIDTPSGVLRSRSLFDLEPDFSAVTGAAPRELDGPGRELWLVLHRQIVKQGQPLTLWIAEDIHALHDRLRWWSVLMVLLVVMAAVVLVLWQYRLLSRGFAVFDRLRQALTARRYEPLDIDAPQIPDEITPLVTEIDRLLEQLRQRTQRTRNALGDLAHELKRPLQMLMLAHEDQEESAPERRALAQLQTLIDRELKRARISGADAVGRRFDPQQDLQPLLEVMRSIHPDVAFSIDLADDLGQMYLDRDDLLELIGNLVDNAGKFADGAVRLRLRRDGGQLLIEVEDDGPDLPEDQRQRVLRKGVRLDETREGQGLGLRICADIIASYQGELRLEDVATGGLLVRVWLPLSDS